MKKTKFKSSWRLAIVAGAFASLAIFNSCGSSHHLLEPETDWIYLGQGTATHIREKDVFKIRSKEKFAAIKFYVFNRAVTIKSVKILLINGDVLMPLIDDHI